MAHRDCNYQRKVTVEDLLEALADGVCHLCGVTTRQLMEKGELLEVCGEEFATDIESGERVLTPVALCPDCHRDYHLDARQQHNPCQIKARFSREGLG